MALTVEDGTVVANANAYISLSYANTYFADDVNYDDTWAAKDDTAKEQLVKWATRILDQKVRWNGYKTQDTSALRWPRSDVYDRDNILIDDDEMPEQLKQAVCELIKLIDGGEDPTTSQGGTGFKAMKVDVVEITYNDNAVQPSVPPILNEILRGLGQYPTIGASSFGKIVKV